MPTNYNASTASFVEAHRTLLSREEEVALFMKWYEADEGRLKDTYLAQIVRSYSPIIKATIREFSGYHADPQELTSEGLIALVQAAQRFDLGRGYRFSTFAKRWVSGVMLGFITKNYFPVNLCTSHNKKKLFFAIRRMIASNLKVSGSFEMNQKIAETLSEEYKVKVGDVYSIYEMIRRPPVSLADPVHVEDPDSLTLQDFVENGEPNVDEIVSNDLRKDFHIRIVDDAITTVLSEREASIFKQQVLVDKEDVVVLEKLGKEWGVSRERIRQIRNQASKKIAAEIRRKFEDLELHPSDVI